MTAPDSRPRSNPSRAAVLCYAFLPFSGAVYLWRRESDELVRFHAWQSILVFLALLGASAVLAVLIVTARFLPASGRALALVPLLIGQLAVQWGGFVLWFALLLKAGRGERPVLPYLGKIAERKAAAGSRWR